VHLIVLPIFVAAAGAFVGAGGLGGTFRGRALPVGVVASAVLAAGLAATTHASDVGFDPLVRGMGLAALLMGAVPFAAFYVLAGVLRRVPVVLVVLLVMTAVPMYYYGFLVSLFVYDLTSCTPDDYECPV
jgi:hypothetical protein